MVGQAKLSNVEFNSLHDFYNATNGIYWRWHNISLNSQPWNFSIPKVNPCFDSWQGLYCSCSLTVCSVTELVLEHHNLSGYLPESIKNFQQLSILNLHGNQIQGTLPYGIGNLTSLIDLDLSSNNFTGKIPVSIGNLMNLIELNLNYNYLSFFPTSLYNLKNLKILSIAYNNLHNNISNAIGNLINLEVLFLRYNVLYSTLPVAIGNLTNLRIIDFRDSILIGSIPRQLYQCRALTSINLRANRLTGTIHPDVGNLVNVASFDLGYNRLYGSIPPTISGMKNLQALILNNNFFSQTIPSSITQLTLLRDFIIEKNSFTGDASVFSNMTTIENFYLAFNYFNSNFTIYSPDSFNRTVYFGISSNLMTGSIPWGANWGRVFVVYEVDSNYFTGQLPKNYEQLERLYYFVVQDNYLSGTVPLTFMQNSSNTYYISLATNLFTGRLPEFYGNHTGLSQLLLYENQFAGNIPTSYTHLTRLVVLDVSYNRLTGTVPPLVNELQFLEELFTENNQLVGNLQSFLNISSVLRLVNIDISDNQFTGSLPDTLFHYTLALQSFAACRNCLDGSIPSSICSLNNLESLSLDGLTTSNNCKSLIFGDNPYFNGFVASHYISGTIPSCLYEIPSLQLLHISGNSLTGSIPTGLNLSAVLTDLSLSHNALRGTIPEEIQERQWMNLDLSYNKFTGTLSNSFASIPCDGELKLQVNRLSGNIPSTLYSAGINVSTNILNGNIFDCDALKTDLPKNDPNYEKYSCATDNVDYVLYAWIAGMIAIPFFLLLLLRCTIKIFQFSQQRSLYVYDKLKIWRDALIDNNEREHIIRLSLYFQQMRIISFYLTIYSIIILIPTYTILKFYSASYSREYTWSISGILNSGKSAAFVTFVILSLFSSFYFFILMNVLKIIRSDSSSSQSRRESIDLDDPKTMIKKDEIPKSDRIRVYLLVCFLNLIIMGFVDFSYVYIVLNYRITIVTIAALALALFRLFTNNIICWSALPLSYQLLMKIKCKWCCFTSSSSSSKTPKTSERSLLLNQLTPDTYTSSDISFLENLVLFNNIIIPILAIIFILPDCFYNALFAPDNIQSSYSYESCYQYFAVLSVGHSCLTYTETTNYSPPFIYSYQCSSKIVANYVPVYIIMFILAGMIIPFLKISLKLIYNYLQEKKENNNNTKNVIKMIEWFLPNYFQPFQSDIVTALSDVNTTPSIYYKDSIAPNNRTIFIGHHQKKRLFSKLTMTIQINSYFTILMCFGALFPPLVVIASMSIYSITFFEELWIGWMLTETRKLGLGYGWYEEQIERECIGVERSTNLTIWSTLIVSCGLYSYIIFDTMGDTVGWQAALPLTMLLLLFPLLLFIIVKSKEKINREGRSCVNKVIQENENQLKLEVRNNDELSTIEDGSSEGRISRIELVINPIFNQPHPVSSIIGKDIDIDKSKDLLASI